MKMDEVDHEPKQNGPVVHVVVVDGKIEKVFPEHMRSEADAYALEKQKKWSICKVTTYPLG